MLVCCVRVEQTRSPMRTIGEQALSDFALLSVQKALVGYGGMYLAQIEDFASLDTEQDILSLLIFD